MDNLRLNKQTILIFIIVMFFAREATSKAAGKGKGRGKENKGKGKENRHKHKNHGKNTGENSDKEKTEDWLEQKKQAHEKWKEEKFRNFEKKFAEKRRELQAEKNERKRAEKQKELMKWLAKKRKEFNKETAKEKRTSDKYSEAEDNREERKEGNGEIKKTEVDWIDKLSDLERSKKEIYKQAGKGLKEVKKAGEKWAKKNKKDAASSEVLSKQSSDSKKPGESPKTVKQQREMIEGNNGETITDAMEEMGAMIKNKPATEIEIPALPKHKATLEEISEKQIELKKMTPEGTATKQKKTIAKNEEQARIEAAQVGTNIIDELLK